MGFWWKWRCHWRCALQRDMRPWALLSLHSGHQHHDHLSSATSSPLGLVTGLKQLHQVTKDQGYWNPWIREPNNPFFLGTLQRLTAVMGADQCGITLLHVNPSVCVSFIPPLNGIKIKKNQNLEKPLAFINMLCYLHTSRKRSKIILVSKW